MRGAFALFLSLAVLAMPAQAQKPPSKPAAKSASSALLRGPLDASSAQPPAEKTTAPAPVAALPPVLAPLATAAPAPDANRCKLTCASDYYFCSANNGSDDCSTSWSQCRAACVAPTLRRDPAIVPPS